MVQDEQQNVTKKGQNKVIIQSNSGCLIKSTGKIIKKMLCFPGEGYIASYDLYFKIFPDLFKFRCKYGILKRLFHY